MLGHCDGAQVAVRLNPNPNLNPKPLTQVLLQQCHCNAAKTLAGTAIVTVVVDFTQCEVRLQLFHVMQPRSSLAANTPGQPS